MYEYCLYVCVLEIAINCAKTRYFDSRPAGACSCIYYSILLFFYLYYYFHLFLFCFVVVVDLGLIFYIVAWLVLDFILLNYLKERMKWKKKLNEHYYYYYYPYMHEYFQINLKILFCKYVKSWWNEMQLPSTTAILSKMKSKSSKLLFILFFPTHQRNTVLALYREHIHSCFIQFDFFL